ncbi:MAG: hypothetical protein RLZ98_1738 [Pseudomonadota bacterium]|jgi:hypothetical protein
MWQVKQLLVAVAAIPAVVLVFTAPADARIRCQGAYQVIDGRFHASPFCGDEHLANVARSYGMRVTGRQIRRNFALKEEACLLVGHDNRAYDVCTGLRQNDRNEGDDSSPN